MKKRLVLWMVMMLISLLCLPVLAEEQEFEEQKPKVYSLDEFLDSVYVYEDFSDVDKIRIVVDSSIRGPEKIIEFERDIAKAIFKPLARLGRISLTLKIFDKLNMSVSNKNGTAEYIIWRFVVQGESPGLQLTVEDFLEGNFNECQKRVLDLVFGSKRAKIKGVIMGHGVSGGNYQDKRFIEVWFHFHILEITEAQK